MNAKQRIQMASDWLDSVIDEITLSDLASTLAQIAIAEALVELNETLKSQTEPAMEVEG